MKPKTKICNCCGMELPSKMFHKGRANKDGLHPRCKICRALDENEEKHRTKYRRKHRIAIRIRQRMRREKSPETTCRYNKKYEKSHRKQINAESLAGKYLRKGIIERKDICEKCSASNPEMHHEDYNKPLEVIWLCRRCHCRHHRVQRRGG